MNNELQTFNHEVLGSIRVITKDGEPWFVGKDVAEVLGYNNSSEALKYHVDDEDKLNSKTLVSLGQRGGWLINESGLYSLILSSKLPAAKAFKRWVTSEVLPTIRKHGIYMTDQTAADALADPTYFLAKALKIADEVMKKQAETISSQQRRIEELTPKATEYDQVMNKEDTYTITDVAEMSGIAGSKLFKILVDIGYMIKLAHKPYTLTKRAPQHMFKLTKTTYGTQIRVTTQGAADLIHMINKAQ